MAGKDYAAIARAKITSPTRNKRAPRLFVYGRNKKGKTRFCTSAPDVLILDPEGGVEGEEKRDPDTWPITSWGDMADVVGFLKSRHNKSPLTGRPYQWCAWDGVTRISSVALNYIRSQEQERDLTRKPSDVKIQDYGKANKLIEEAVHQFHALRDTGLIFTAQERMIEIANMEDFDEDEEASPAGYMYVPDLPKGARAPFNQVVDVIGRIYVVRGDFTTTKRVRDRTTGKVTTRESPTRLQRRLWVSPHTMYDTGYRSDIPDLPDYIPNPTVLGVVKAMKEGVKK